MKRGRSPVVSTGAEWHPSDGAWKGDEPVRFPGRLRNGTEEEKKANVKT